MAAAGPVERPPGDKDINRDLPEKVPEPKVSFGDVRKGWTALMRANVRFLDSDGADMTGIITDTMIDSSGKEFEGYFQKYGLKGRHMGRLIADAANATVIERLPKDSVVFTEGLVFEAHRIAREKKTMYDVMQDDERLKLASFLWRPPDERPLPHDEWWGLLFPTTMEEMKYVDREGPPGVKEVNEKGLRKVLRCMLESDTLDFSGMDRIDKLWVERGWEEYREHPKPAHMSMKGGDWSISVSLAQPETDNPQIVENLLVDVINYMGGRETRNLSEITQAAKKVLAERKRLQELDYFEPQTNETERHVMIQKVLEDRALF